jgi:hypothetical protein
LIYDIRVHLMNPKGTNLFNVIPLSNESNFDLLGISNITHGLICTLSNLVDIFPTS